MPHALRATRSYWPAQPDDAQPVSSVVVIEEERSSVHALPANGMVLIGRGPEADISLETEAASRKHARLIVTDGRVHIIDLDSHNGTQVNGEPRRGRGCSTAVS
jgi:pSer/pThr/pTyr-binding forkhead associated (FHA) protein